jgi:hypothetical protein
MNGVRGGFLCRSRVLVQRRRYGFYKLQEWLDEDPHRHLRNVMDWGWEEVVVKDGEVTKIAVPEGYLSECFPLPELEKSAGETYDATERINARKS